MTRLSALPALICSPVDGKPSLRCDSVASTPYDVIITMRVAHRREYPPRLVTNGFKNSAENGSERNLINETFLFILLDCTFVI